MAAGKAAERSTSAHHLLQLLLFLLLISLLSFATLLNNVAGMSSPNSSERSAPFRVELIDTGPRCNGRRNIICKLSPADDIYYVRLRRLTSGASLELKLYRDPALNRQLTSHTDYNVFVIDENGVDLERVDGLDLHNDHRQAADSKVAFFRGKLVSSHPGSLTEISNTTVFAMGYLDDRNGFISIQAFIRQEDGTLLYLHPGTEIEDSVSITSSNLHYLSTENDQMGSSFFEHFQRQFAQQEEQRRRKRSSSGDTIEEKVEKRCPMMIMADYSLYQLMNESRAKTVLFIHFVFTLANDIFVSTTFTQSGLSPEEDEKFEEGFDQFVGYGHSLCRIVIEEHQAERPTDQLYNGNRTYWPQAELEAKLKALRGRENVCLAFLFTNLPISASAESRYADVNGFAMIGGIFSQTMALSNVGVVSFARCKDPWNLLCALTFPHELGHLWGATHDIESADCMPAENGSYLVSFPFLDQIGPNNFKFSPCSIRSIYKKIEELSASRDFISYCSKCGNGIVEDDEQCDEMSFIEGSEHSFGDDDEAVNGRHLGDCCTRSCKLKAEASCSPHNHQCCDDQCGIVLKNSSTVCLQADLQYCYAKAFCDGSFNGCPVKERRPKMADGEPCLNGGKCFAGYCNSTCPAGSADCECQHDSCRVCCEEVFKNETQDTVTRGECRPLTDVFRPEGTHCLFNETERGFCSANGWCVARKVDDDDTIGTVPPSASPDDGIDFDEDDFWTLVQVVGVATFIVIIFVLVFIIRALIRCAHSGRFELYQTTVDGFNEAGSERNLLNNAADDAGGGKEDDNQPKEAESCFSHCLPSSSKSVKISPPPALTSQRSFNGYSSGKKKSGNNV